MRRTATILVEASATALAILLFLIPTVAAVRAAAGADLATAALDSRRVGLLLRGLRIALAGGLLAQVFGSGLAVALVRSPRTLLYRLGLWVGLVVLLTPPYVYAYAWSLPLLPEGIATYNALSDPGRAWLVTEGRAILCLGLWTAPLAAAMFAAGWRAHGRPAWQMALVDAGPLRAWWRVGLPAMWPWLALSLTVCFALASTEYTVCHLCLVRVWNTEILVEAQLLARPGQALLLGWPMLVLIGVLVAVWLPARRRLAALLDELAGLRGAATEAGARRSYRSALTTALAVCVTLLMLVPWVMLIEAIHRLSAMLTALATFRAAWLDGLLIGLGAALVCLWVALGLELLVSGPGWSRTRRACYGALVVAALVFGLAPPALVGDALSAAYTDWPVIADGPWIVSLVAAARYAWIAIGLVALGLRLADRRLTDAAEVDRADHWARFWDVRVPLAWPAVVAAGASTFVLCLTEVSASQMVTPPGVENLARTLLNMIHYGRDDEVAATIVTLLLLIALLMLVICRLVRPRSPQTA